MGHAMSSNFRMFFFTMAVKHGNVCNLDYISDSKSELLVIKSKLHFKGLLHPKIKFLSCRSKPVRSFIRFRDTI